MAPAFRARLAPILLALVALTAPAVAQPSFDPRPYQRQVAGERTQILVLATPHLSGTPEDWDPAVLAPLLDRLAAFRPDAIAIEALPGRQVAQLWQYRAVYPEMATSYGGRIMIMAGSAAAGTGMDMPQAEAEIRRLLADWPDSPTPAQRRRLAALFAASGDPHSALVQWWRLDPTERRAEDGINAPLMAQLNEYDRRRNENHLIGSRLAARLRLERVHPTDAQDDDVMTPEQMEAFGRLVFQPLGEELRADPRFRPLMEASQRLRSPEEALATFRMLNAPATGQTNADLEWLRMIDRPVEGDLGRVRVGGWEVRNLRMAANIREVASRFPGGRVLVIVGSGHKPWLDAYLGMMSDVAIADSEALLR